MTFSSPRNSTFFGNFSKRELKLVKFLPQELFSPEGGTEVQHNLNLQSS